jgi:hypothetical protein
LATDNKDFRVKNGLIVEGNSATVDGNNVLTDASSIDDLADINVSGVFDGQTLIYNETTESWLPGRGNYTISSSAPESPRAGDVWFNSNTGRSYIYYKDENETEQWIEIGSVQGPTGPAGESSNNLDGLTDVTLSDPTAGQILEYTGTVWVNGQIDTAGIENGAVTRDKINDNAMLGFTEQVTFASNTAWTVPSLARPKVKVTIIGGGGGGGGGQGSSGTVAGAGGNGGTSTFNAGGAGTFSAGGGSGGAPPAGTGARDSTAGFSAGNGGMGGQSNNDGNVRGQGLHGNGGDMIVRYVDLTGISSVEITIGPGGTAGAAGGSGQVGNAGGRGEIIVEYVEA